MSGRLKMKRARLDVGYVKDDWLAEMSFGLDLDWTGSGLWPILWNLDWIRTGNYLQI